MMEGMARSSVVVHAPADRPDVEVLVDDVWCVGEVRMQWREDGSWWAEVQWRPPGTTTRRLDNFPAERIRKV